MSRLWVSRVQSVHGDIQWNPHPLGPSTNPTLASVVDTSADRVVNLHRGPEVSRHLERIQPDPKTGNSEHRSVTGGQSLPRWRAGGTSNRRYMLRR